MSMISVSISWWEGIFEKCGDCGRRKIFGVGWKFVYRGNGNRLDTPKVDFQNTLMNIRTLLDDAELPDEAKMVLIFTAIADMRMNIQDMREKARSGVELCPKCQNQPSWVDLKKRQLRFA